ncbi:MAG TPA: hypothetical protein VN643_18935 [Pyrinomonadaceae bacterium]|nr:hypothetical protein [Pyrinomonadaceae bacterium]
MPLTGGDYELPGAKVPAVFVRQAASLSILVRHFGSVTLAPCGNALQAGSLQHSRMACCAAQLIYCSLAQPPNILWSRSRASQVIVAAELWHGRLARDSHIGKYADATH